MCILYQVSSSFHQAVVRLSNLSTVLQMAVDQIVGQMSNQASRMECKSAHTCTVF